MSYVKKQYQDKPTTSYKQSDEDYKKGGSYAYKGNDDSNSYRKQGGYKNSKPDSHYSESNSRSNYSSTNYSSKNYENDRYYDSYSSKGQYSKDGDDDYYYEKKDSYSKGYDNRNRGYEKNDDWNKGKSEGFQKDNWNKGKEKYAEDTGYYQKKADGSKEEKKVEQKPVENAQGSKDNLSKQKNEKHVHFEDAQQQKAGSQVQYVQRSEPSTQASEQKKTTDETNATNAEKNNKFFDKTPSKGPETQQTTNAQNTNQTTQSNTAHQTTTTTPQGDQQPQGSQIPIQQPQPSPLIVQQQPPMFVPFNPLSVISTQGQKDLPPMFQMPYIVFPLSNGTAIIQPLYIPNGYNANPLGFMNPFGGNLPGFVPQNPIVTQQTPHISQQDLFNLIAASGFLNKPN